MHKDSLLLLLVIAVFALIGADCQAPWEDEDEEKDPLPDRALASSPLLRAYYDMRTIPKGMRELKIPEGDDFDDNELTIEFEMGGAEVVTEVRTHLFLMPPVGVAFSDCELVCRCISPSDTTSSWKPLDIEVSDTFDPQVEIPFMFEFDGEVSDGLWQIQIRDSLEDKDGRCLFRNGSLHINRGEATGLGGASSETVTLGAAVGNYDVIPEQSGKREPLDPGHIGMKPMLRNDFVFVSSFFVQQITLTASFYVNADADLESRTNWILVAPSGNWIALAFGDNPVGLIDINENLKCVTYTFTISSTPTGPLLNLNGEPSGGTWSLYIVDTLVDNNTSTLTTDEADTIGGTINPDDGALEITLDGIS